MTTKITDAEMDAYLEEALTPQQMALVEQELRARPELLSRLSEINGRRDAGMHSLGEIWRRNRISCPTREQLGSYLLGVLDDEQMEYVRFHLKTVACRLCHANLYDLERRQAESNESVVVRRRKYFDSSAGYLRKQD